VSGAAVLATFAKTKVARATKWCESSAFACAVAQRVAHEQVQSFRALRAQLPFVAAKGSKTAFAGPQEGIENTRRRYAAVPCAPQLKWHGAGTRCAQTPAPLRPFQPPVLGSLYGLRRPEAKKNTSNCQSNGKA
jgi:hypothetical protein